MHCCFNITIENYKIIYENDTFNKLRGMLPKMHQWVIFDEDSESTQEDEMVEETYPNPFKDHPKWGAGHKAIKGILVLENLVKGFGHLSFMDMKLGTYTGQKHSYIGKSLGLNSQIHNTICIFSWSLMLVIII